MNTRDYAKKYAKEIIALRRHFHQYPESSFMEFETSKKIRQELDEMGIDYKLVHETGVLAKITGAKPGKTVLLRADMDALEVEEKNTHDYVSKNPGRMHACGHDGHTAMLLGAAKILHNLRDQLEGDVVLCFQPAEEVGQGAKVMIEEGQALEGVDGAFGIHLWSDLPVGKISVEEGPRMASADSFEIKIQGSGGHGSMPHQTVDPIIVGSAMVMNLQTIVSREVNPLDPLVVTVGSFNSGTRFNVIPESCVLTGTTRCFNPELWADIDSKIKRVAQYTASTYRASVEIDYKKILPPTINDPQASRLAARSVEKIAGADALTLMEKTTGGEDFSYFANKVPSCFAFVGIRNEEKEASYPHHHEKFQMDEDALELGTALYVQYAIDFLAEK